MRNNFITNYADLSKTADKVRHKQIIRKLKRNEILVKLLKLVKDLEQRTTEHLVTYFVFILKHQLNSQWDITFTIFRGKQHGTLPVTMNKDMP